MVFLLYISLIVALKIHISEATKNILDSLGGFLIEERGEVFLKVTKHFIYLQDDQILQCFQRNIGMSFDHAKFYFKFMLPFQYCCKPLWGTRYYTAVHSLYKESHSFTHHPRVKYESNQLSRLCLITQ